MSIQKYTVSYITVSINIVYIAVVELLRIYLSSRALSGDYRSSESSSISGCKVLGLYSSIIIVVGVAVVEP